MARVPTRVRTRVSCRMQATAKDDSMVSIDITCEYYQDAVPSVGSGSNLADSVINTLSYC